MQTAIAEVKSAGSPDEVRAFTDGKGQAEVVKFGDREVIRGTYEPGWRWSENVKPLAGTDSCQTTHFGYCIQGTMRIKLDNGEEMTMSPGDFMSIPPGHDAWIEGDETCIFIDFGDVAHFAKH